jgi:DNA-binding NarL/FixJ family response regulator
VIHILVADDHPLVRRGVRNLLEETFSSIQVGEAADGPETLQKVRQQQWDLVILDIGLPGRGGLEVLSDLRTFSRRPPVIIQSMYPEEQYAVRALKTGAAGYLTKQSASEELIAAVRKVLRGGRYITSSLAERLASELAGDYSRPLHELLSNRELAVLCLLASGKTVKQVAAELALSVKTISTYRSRILKKTGLSSTAELIRYCFQHNLVPSQG